MTETSPKFTITIGSKPSNDVVLDSPTVSGFHAQVSWSEAKQCWLLEDVGSTNGTFLNDTKLAPGVPVPVQVGDNIGLGKSTIFTLSWEHLGYIGGESIPTEPGRDTLPGVDTHPNVPVVARDRSVGAPHDNDQSDGDQGDGGPDDTTESNSPVGKREIIADYGPSLSHKRSWGSLDLHMTTEIKAPEGLSSQTGPAVVPLEPEIRQTISFDPRSVTGVHGEKELAHLEEPEAPPLDAPAITIGYADDNVVQIKNPVVSGHHAKLFKLGPDEYLLEDQGSTNGTWFAGRRVQRALMTADDEFGLGNQGVAVWDLISYFAVLEDSLKARGTALPTLLQPIVIGRGPECDLRLDAPMVSNRHCRLSPLPTGQLQAEDLGSTNGTYVNSRDNAITSATVGADDVIFLGSYRLPLSRLGQLLEEGGGEQAIAIPPDKELMIIGRDADCDIVLPVPQVSRRHAELRRFPDGSFELRDLGGVNGTYVNGERIKTRRRVTAEDLISFASFRLHLDADASVIRRDYHGDIMLQAERVTVKVKDKRSKGGYKTILEDASFTAYPTEFVGLMGPSGAGKTTLMLALNGYTPPTAGRSLINGSDLYTNYDSFRGNIGYVPQDDIIFRELTVYESLYYTGKLRLPPDTTDEEIDRKILDILDKLEIQGTRDVIIGDALKKGISGGQRKRVNLAQELLTEPSLLFLDEPTSGLASEDALNVMNLLRRLADEGRTIILTIHQPSLEAYRKLDNVIYLYQGRLVYYGPAYPESITYFNPKVEAGTPDGDLVLSDPGNALKVLGQQHRAAMDAEDPWAAVEQVVEGRRSEFLQSKHYKDFVYDRAVAPRDAVRLDPGNKQKTRRRGFARQWGILTRRCAAIKRKDTVNTAILLLQAPIIGIVLWLVFAGQIDNYFDRLARGPAALFLLVASAVWFGCSNSAREIVQEQTIYKRERMVNLIIPSYVASKLTVLGVVCAAQCAILLAIVYPALGFESSWLGMYAIMLVSSLAGVGMGLTLSAMVRSSEAAMALVPLLLIPQIVLGGVIMPIHDLNPPMQALSVTMVSRWGFEGLVHIEYGADDLETIQRRCGIDVCPDPLAITEADANDDANDDDLEQAPTSSDERPEVELVAPGDGRRYAPNGAGALEDVCNILCTNARRGNEITPLERTFGLNVQPDDARRHWYRTNYDVGSMGVRTGLGTVFLVLLVLNMLLFGLVCALLRYKDVEVG